MQNFIRPHVSPSEEQARQGIVAVIPARGGSKGIPGKNIAPVGGKPLIAYSIEAALQSRRVDRVVVSTDDEEVAQVAREWGAWVPWLRPRAIAEDSSSLFHVWEDAKQRLRALGVPLRGLVKLLPTHPFRTPGMIDLVLDHLLAGSTALTVMRRIERPLHRFFVPDAENPACLAPVWKDLGQNNVQDWPLMRPYGLISAVAFSRPHQRRFFVVDNPICLIDIDTPEDLALADAVVRHGLFDFTAATPHLRPAPCPVEPSRRSRVPELEPC